MSGSLAQRLWGIPQVRNNDERDALFPNPSTGQRVDNAFTGTIQRWNGASWLDIYFAGALSTGTPQTLVNDVQILAQPQANNFKGRVEGLADGTTADVTIPDIPVANAGGDVVASPRRLRFTGGAVVTDEGSGEAKVAIPTGGAIRTDVTLSTADLDFEEVETGTVTLGALSVLLKVVSSCACWVRLYSTAADRTADAARLITDDPTTPIVLELVYSGAGTELLYPPVLAPNLDAVTANVLYYSIQQLDPGAGGGPFTQLFDAVIASPGGVDTDINGYAITTPGTSGATVWEYNTAGGASMVRWATFGGLKDAGSGNPMVRVAGASLDHSSLRLTALAYRLALDGGGIGCSVFAHVPSTAIGSYNSDDCLQAEVSRQDASLVVVALKHVDVGGAVTTIDSTISVPWAGDETRNLILEIEAGVATVFLANEDGTGKTPYATGPVPASVQDNTRVGITTSWNGATAGFQVAELLAETSAVDPLPVDLTITRTRLEVA